MPIVYLPLLSAEAHGAFGDVIIYQGQKCRIYKVPHDPRTEAQTDVRKMFYDVTKMETFCGAWAKAAWKTAFGSRWYTSLYKRVTENGSERFNAADAVWDGYTQGQKDAWNAAAPFQVTYNAPGTVFHALMSVMADWLAELGAPNFEFPGIDPDGVGAVATWAARTLDGAFTQGEYEDGNALFDYGGTWTDESDVNASGGSYHLSAASGSPTVQFYVYGTQFKLRYQKAAGNGNALIETFGVADQNLSMSDSGTSWGNEWTSAAMEKGLHLVTITRQGEGAINLDGLWATEKRITTTARTAIKDYFVIPGASVTLQADHLVPFNSWHAIPWDSMVWDTQGMFDAVGNNTRLTCKVPGFYSVNVSLKMTRVNTTIGQMEVRLNGNVIASDEGQTPSTGAVAWWFLRAVRNVEIVEGDYLEVWVNKYSGGNLYVEADGDGYPIFELQMLQKTTLQVNEVNITQQVGTNDHGDLTGLGDDDHSQYYNQARGDARYSVLAHTHIAGKYAIPLYTHLGSVGVPGPAGTVRYAYPPHTVYFSGIGGINIPGAGTLKNLFVRLSSAQPGTGGLVITVQKNFAGTGLSVTIPAGSAGGQTFTNLVNTVAWNSGDILTWHIQNNAGTTSGGIGALAVELEKTTT